MLDGDGSSSQLGIHSGKNKLERNRFSSAIRELDHNTQGERKHNHCNSSFRIAFVSYNVIQMLFLVLIEFETSFSDKDYFPDPYRYDPDRWSKENREHIPKYAFLGFGEGPRICLGMKFALTQMKGGVAAILSKYDVITCSKTEIPVKFSKSTFNLQPQNGIWLKLVKRNK